MGLYIIAVNKIKKIANFSENWENLVDIDDKKLIRVKINNLFSSHDHLESGIYVYEGEEMELSCGAYSSYSNFRNTLSNIAHNIDSTEIWNNYEMFKGEAFYELINFSDCDGVIGPTSSTRLLSDFKRYKEDFFKISNEWDCEYYEDWIKILEIASNDGMLVFT